MLEETNLKFENKKIYQIVGIFAMIIAAYSGFRKGFFIDFIFALAVPWTILLGLVHTTIGFRNFKKSIFTFLSLILLILTSLVPFIWNILIRPFDAIGIMIIFAYFAVLLLNFISTILLIIGLIKK